MKWLKKLLIKDYEKTKSPAVRFRYGIAAGIIGIVSNALLFAGKIVIGLISGSITIVADAINNLSDMGSSVVTVSGFKLAARPPDKEHPFGHARYEYIATFIIAMIILAIGVLLGKSSIEKIIEPSDISFSAATYAVLGAAIVVKILQMLVYLDFGKAINSDMLKASAVDSRNDIITTSAVLIATIIMAVTGVNIDGYMGIAVSVFIVVSSLKLLKDTLDPMLGTRPDKDTVKMVKEKILSYEGVLGIHDLMIHNYGKMKIFVTAHVEVSASVDVLESHDLIDNIERDFKDDLGICLTIHMDPLQDDNELISGLREKVMEILNDVSKDLSIHDFRVVAGYDHTNILFDVVVPFSSDLTLEDIVLSCEEGFKNDEGKKYYFVVDLDRDYV